MKITQLKKNPTWTDLITGLEIGEEIYVSEKDAKSIRPLISVSIALKHPERVFETEKVTDSRMSAVRVKRVEDKELIKTA